MASTCSADVRSPDRREGRCEALVLVDDAVAEGEHVERRCGACPGAPPEPGGSLRITARSTFSRESAGLEIRRRREANIPHSPWTILSTGNPTTEGRPRDRTWPEPPTIETGAGTLRTGDRTILVSSRHDRTTATGRDSMPLMKFERSRASGPARRMEGGEGSDRLCTLSSDSPSARTHGCPPLGCWSRPVLMDPRSSCGGGVRRAEGRVSGAPSYRRRAAADQENASITALQSRRKRSLSSKWMLIQNWRAPAAAAASIFAAHSSTVPATANRSAR